MPTVQEASTTTAKIARLARAARERRTEAEWNDSWFQCQFTSVVFLTDELVRESELRAFVSCVHPSMGRLSIALDVQ